MEKLLRRYARQVAVPEIGSKGQEVLSSSKVLIIGCGALGSMVAMQLAGAGVGNIGIVDFDTIDVTNLQRQFFFKTEEAGLSKVRVLGKRLRELNPEIVIEEYDFVMTTHKATKLFPNYDFVVDATDNPESKALTGKISYEYKKGCCIGGVRDFEGQVMTFLPDSSRFEDYFGHSSAEGFLPCSLSGVMGPGAALCASIQTAETIKYLTNSGKLLSGTILLFNLLDCSFRKFNL